MNQFQGCPGSKMMQFDTPAPLAPQPASGASTSQLRQWPVQLHLVSPQAPYYQKADVLLAADCVAYALGDFHQKHLQGKALAIACPKLDARQEIYLEKVKSWIDDAEINTLSVMIMEVPCCRGLLNLVQKATQAAGRKIPVKSIVVGIKGQVLQENWL